MILNAINLVMLQLPDMQQSDKSFYKRVCESNKPLIMKSLTDTLLS